MVYFKTEIKTKFLKTNRKGVYNNYTKNEKYHSLFKDLDPNFWTVHYITGTCIIAIGQNTFYLMAASEIIEIYIQQNQQQENLHLKAATQSWSGKGCSQI